MTGSQRYAEMITNYTDRYMEEDIFHAKESPFVADLGLVLLVLTIFHRSQQSMTADVAISAFDRDPVELTSAVASRLMRGRLRRNTFLPGEQIEGTVKLAVSSQDHDVEIEEATVQAHGYVKVDPRWITLPSSLRSLFHQDDATVSQKDTPIPRYSGLDDSSACVFASEVAVLLKREKLSREEPAIFSFSLVLPNKLTPTFRGVGVRYAYAVTISVKRALPPQIGPGGRLLGLVRRRNTSLGEFSTNELHVAFTVLSEGIDMHGSVSPRVSGIIPSVAGVNNVSGEGQKEDWGRVAYSDLEVERQSGESLRAESVRTTPGGLVSGTRAVTWNMQGRALDDYPGDFLSTSGEDDLYGQMHEPNGGLRGETAPPMVYSIRSGDSRIGSFVLHKAEFCAGDVVLGNFDFSEASTRCLQVCACLQMSEENVFSGVAASPSSQSKRSSCHRRVVDASKELTPCVTQSSVALSLPMDAPVTFVTELVSVNWLLRFEFVMEVPTAESKWTGGLPKTSVLRWEVPIRVVPPRRALAWAGGMSGREQTFNAMDATGKTMSC